ncbi:MAG: DUF3732 domain-containing protein [Eubacteriales bacterium]|nr:DUF3732 domain-containing protein [Eubacteriales bacterium]
MKSYIKSIIIFNENGEKRIVPLKQGVNIITGESKTGKSALVEIIDYCLCSTRCTIPKGIITNFAYVYALVMNIGDNSYIIARYTGENMNKMHFIKESQDYDANTLELSYFKDKTPLAYKNVQYEIECALGLFVSNMSTGLEEKEKKASLRNMVSYLFQHQNLMASKFALFYRFSDYYKRKEVIEQFPVFAGMIGQEYYSDLIQLSTLKVKLKQKEKRQKANEKSEEYIKQNLRVLLQNYYALIDRDFDDDLTLKKMLEIAKNLPDFDNSELFGENKITEHYSKLNAELEELRNQERDILLKIKNTGNASLTGNSFSEMLKELKEQISVSEIEADKYICPICGHDCQEVAERDVELIEATEWLNQELKLTEKYTADFSEDVRKLKAEHSKLEEKIREVWNQIKVIEQKFISSQNLLSKREKVNYAKAKIMVCVEMSASGIFDMVDEDIEDIKNQIKVLEEKIKGFDVETKMNKAQSFLSDNMNKLAQTLDFEDEYQPVNLNFGLTDGSFDLYQHQNHKQKIFLYEMGSGANWVSCHIALFMSFLHYFAKQESSPMPLFMFFDQPSQVYFPQGNIHDSEVTQLDITAVNKMYKTIFDEIKEIEEDTGILPQIIIVDHVDGEGLDINEEFVSNICCNWRNEEKLI